MYAREIIIIILSDKPCIVFNIFEPIMARTAVFSIVGPQTQDCCIYRIWTTDPDLLYFLCLELIPRSVVFPILDHRPITISFFLYLDLIARNAVFPTFGPHPQNCCISYVWTTDPRLQYFQSLDHRPRTDVFKILGPNTQDGVYYVWTTNQGLWHFLYLNFIA